MNALDDDAGLFALTCTRHPRVRSFVVLAVACGAAAQRASETTSAPTAQCASRPASPEGGKHASRPVWIGTFRPKPEDVAESDDRTVIGHAGEIIVLTPSDGSPTPTGDVTVVQPLVGMNIVATIERPGAGTRSGTIAGRGRIALPLFAFDRRPGADAVLLLPADARVVFVTPSAADIAGIRKALLRNEVLSGVPRSLVDIEVGAIDVDGDHKPDYAITYGCNAWADGQCQSRGEFLLASRGTAWVELE
jgi:hypothetical protein